VIQTSENIDKKEQILIEAERLFSEQDFDAVSVRDLAKEAGVNIAMISYYFGSKEKLFETLIIRRIGDSQGNVREIATSNLPVADKMCALIDYYVERFITHRTFQKLIQRELSVNSRPAFKALILEKIRANKDYTKAMMEEGIASGVGVAFDMEMLMMSFFSSLYQITGSPQFTCQIFAMNDENALYDHDFKERIKNHFKSIIRYQLTIKS